MSDFILSEYGKISSKHKISQLKEICVAKDGIQTGPFGSQLHKEDYVEEGTPIITVEHLDSGFIKADNAPRVSNEDLRRLNKYTLKEGDIVFSRVGSVDRRSLVRKNEDGWMFSGRCLRVRANKEKISPEYLSYFFGTEAFKNHIRSIAVGATMPSINTKLLSDVRVLYPPLPEQKAIAHILGTLDNKIELNRKMNQTLEAMAQALFKSWFVDFDPVLDNALASRKAIPEALKAKAEKRKALLDRHSALDAESATTVNGAPLLYANPELANLFPSSFEYNETLDKWVPEGWEVKSLDQLITLIGGGTPKTSIDDYWNGDIPWFSVVDAPTDSDVFVIETEKRVTQKGVDNSSTKVLPEWTTIISARGTVGKCALVGVPMAMNQSCYGVRNENQNIFTYLVLKKNVSDLQNKSHGSVFNTITRDTFKTINVTTPPNYGLIEGFEKLILSSFEKIKSNLFENQTLTQLRDTLLPQLISGKVRVPENVIAE